MYCKFKKRLYLCNTKQTKTLNTMFASTNTTDLKKVKETEKAIGFKGWKNYIGSSKTWEVVVWVPKSIIKENVIPSWFIGKTESNWAAEGVNIVTELA